jgi:creatinine amidohydrolase/Fe(II)-dependent formamide hydrolase-like protein
MRSTALATALALTAALVMPVIGHAQAPATKATPKSAKEAPKAKGPLVEFEMMTWPEVKAALDAGKTTALFYTGGTEQRGPQNVNGGHNLMARATVKEIALRLGNAIAMPVLPYTPNNASAALPGTIGLTPELLSATLERLAEQAIVTGFKNVVLMGDHGGGQPNAYKSVADKLEQKYASQGIHVFFCDEVYAKAQGDFDKMLAEKGLPVSSHAGIPDTSEMLYLGGQEWTREELIPTALGDTLPRGATRDPNVPRINNGITGDARKSSRELGKMAFENKVNYAVRQIKTFIPQ